MYTREQSGARVQRGLSLGAKWKLYSVDGRTPDVLLRCRVLACQIRDREGLDRAIFAAKESTEHASNLCSRVAQAMLAKGPVNKLGPLLKEAKAGIDTAQVRVAAKCVALHIVPPACVRGQCVAPVFSLHVALIP